MDRRQDPVLKRRLQVDEKITAADNVQSGEMAILRDVMMGENRHVPDVLFLPCRIALTCEITAQPLGADIGSDT